jgi:hypothetical protein
MLQCALDEDHEGEHVTIKDGNPLAVEAARVGEPEETVDEMIKRVRREPVPREHFDGVCEQRDAWIHWADAMLKLAGVNGYPLSQDQKRAQLSSVVRAAATPPAPKRPHNDKREFYNVDCATPPATGQAYTRPAFHVNYEDAPATGAKCVLESLATRRQLPNSYCWCETPQWDSMKPHEAHCKAAKELYEKC